MSALPLNLHKCLGFGFLLLLASTAWAQEDSPALEQPQPAVRLFYELHYSDYGLLEGRSFLPGGVFVTIWQDYALLQYKGGATHGLAILLQRRTRQLVLIDSLNERLILYPSKEHAALQWQQTAATKQIEGLTCNTYRTSERLPNGATRQMEFYCSVLYPEFAQALAEVTGLPMPADAGMPLGWRVSFSGGYQFTASIYERPEELNLPVPTLPDDWLRQPANPKMDLPLMPAPIR